MPSDTRNVKLGVCTVTFDGHDLGFTKGGVEFSVTTDTHEVMIDQFGNTPVNDVIMGRKASVKVPLAETTLENLVRVMPGSTLIDVGGTAASGSVTFATAAPVNGDKVTVNGVDFTFKTVPDAANPNEMAIPGSINAAAAALAAAINNSIDPKVSQVTAVAAAAVVTITADDEGVAGNAVTLAKTFVTGANCTLSGATLTGGAAATGKVAQVTSGVGLSLLDTAKVLVLHPAANDPANRSEDVTIPLANTAGAMSFSYKIDTERTFPVEFKGYPDPATKVLYYVGSRAVAG